MDHFCYFCLVLLCFCVRLLIYDLWLPAGQGLTSWLSSVMSNCDVVTFPLVSCIDPFLTLQPLDGWLRVGLLPLGNLADISVLVENWKLSLLRNVCTLCVGVLVR